jgi:hypothetical protein
MSHTLSLIICYSSIAIAAATLITLLIIAERDARKVESCTTKAPEELPVETEHLHSGQTSKISRNARELQDDTAFLSYGQSALATKTKSRSVQRSGSVSDFYSASSPAVCCSPPPSGDACLDCPFVRSTNHTTGAK